MSVSRRNFVKLAAAIGALTGSGLLFADHVAGRKNRVFIIYGQSNSTGTVDYSQTWRTPSPWDSYLESYEGERDGSKFITTDLASAFTLDSDCASLTNLDRMAFGIDAGEGPVYGIISHISKAFPNDNLIIFGHGRGSQYIEQLIKPSKDLILNGDNYNKPLTKQSSDYNVVSGNKSLLYYREPKFRYPYLNGMWMLEKIKDVVKSDIQVDGIFWIQGENDAISPKGYSEKLLSFRNDYVKDIINITGQGKEPEFIFEQSNYCWHGFKTEGRRINSHFGLNVEQRMAHDKAKHSGIKMYISGPRYHLTNEIHMYPHAQRAHGEKMAQAYLTSKLSGSSWSPLCYKSHSIDGNSIIIKFNIPVKPLQFRKTLNGMYSFIKDGCPMGFHFTGKKLSASDVKIISDDTVSINTSGLKGTVSYLKESRIGELCDSDEFPNHFKDRYHADNCMLNYCLPFEIEV
ncbi:TPA: sialate O-acetylesterase [Escherichia coli]|nr:sialate O-acetylesterase [Escherichia coli]